MASRIASEPVADKIGDTKVETIKMMPNVPNRERAEDAVNFEGLPSKNAQEIAQEIAISYNPKKPKK